MVHMTSTLLSAPINFANVSGAPFKRPLKIFPKLWQKSLVQLMTQCCEWKKDLKLALYNITIVSISRAGDSTSPFSSGEVWGYAIFYQIWLQCGDVLFNVHVNNHNCSINCYAILKIPPCGYGIKLERQKKDDTLAYPKNLSLDIPSLITNGAALYLHRIRCYSEHGLWGTWLSLVLYGIGGTGHSHFG